MRIRFGEVIAGLAIFVMAAPVWARPRTDTAQLDVTDTITVAGTELQHGTYKLQAEENGNQLRISRDGKLIAEVPCQWVQLPKKADQTQVISTGNHVDEIDFHGKTQAVQLK